MVDILVPTDPMAREMHHISGAVSSVSSAVDDMARTVCAAEQAAADNVCQKLDKGFLNVIASQISQKKVLAMTTATSQLEHMRMLAQSLVRIKEQMGRDYERITSRYTKLFKKLAELLRSRIYEIDRPAADISDGQYNAMEHRVMMNAASMPVLEDDVSVASAALSVARCKSDCLKVIDGMKTIVEHGMNLRDAMASIVTDKQIAERETYYLPVVIMASQDIFLKDGTNTDYVIGDESAQAALAPAIRSKFFEQVDAVNWQDADDKHRERVIDGVRRRISSENLDPRTAKIMAGLLDASSWQVPESRP